MTFDSLVAEFNAWTTANDIAENEGDAQEILMGRPILTQTQRDWLTDFIERWEEMSDRDHDQRTWTVGSNR